MKYKYYSKTFGKKMLFVLSLWQTEYSAKKKGIVLLLPTILWRGGYLKKQFFIGIRFLFWGIDFNSIPRLWK